MKNSKMLYCGTNTLHDQSLARLLESAGILPFSCQERRGDDSPGWRQARPTAVGWEGGWGYAVTGQLSDSVRRR